MLYYRYINSKIIRIYSSVVHLYGSEIFGLGLQQFEIQRVDTCMYGTSSKLNQHCPKLKHVDCVISICNSLSQLNALNFN